VLAEAHGAGAAHARTLDLGFDVDCSARGTAAVVDGARVLLTPLRLAAVPPPLAAAAVVLPAPAACVALRDCGGVEVGALRRGRAPHMRACCSLTLTQPYRCMWTALLLAAALRCSSLLAEAVE